MKPENRSSWAAEEFAEIKLGDKRLDARLVKLCERFSDSPESSINQACVDWTETKAAYRFFQNDKVEVGKMLAAHRCKTAQRAKEVEINKSSIFCCILSFLMIFLSHDIKRENRCNKNQVQGSAN